MSKKRTCLVTGGCGFIGSHLVKRLYDDGWQVDIVDDLSNSTQEQLGDKFEGYAAGTVRGCFGPSLIDTLPTNAVRLAFSDFAEPAMLQRVRDGKYDVIFHLAAIPRVAYSVFDPVSTTETNIGKTIKLFHAAIGSVDKIVWSSSSSIYGGPDVLPIHESFEKRPRSPYAWQKSSIEDAAKIFCELYDIDITCLRYFSVFGPGQEGSSSYSTVVAAWCDAIFNDKQLRIDGTGEQRRDLCYVDNVVDANVLAAKSTMKFNGRCYNVGVGDVISLNEILDHFKKLFKITDERVDRAPTRAGDVFQTQADIRRICEELDYVPKVKFWEGLEKTVEWWATRK
jgi:nucleoside-diphosphate-sugar epimerase